MASEALNSSTATRAVLHTPDNGSIPHGRLNGFLRRKEAAAHLRERFGFGSTATLAKLASIGGGPRFRKLGSRVVLYDPADLSEWALSKLGRPQTSTSDVQATNLNQKECA